MRTRDLVAAAALSLCLFTSCLAAESAAAPSSPPAPAPASDSVSVFHAVQFDMESKIVGRRYRIMVYTPVAPAPPGGYPVLFHSDGFFFPNVAMAATLAEYGGMRGTMVVGVTWATDDAALGLKYRNKDLTVPTDPANVPSVPGLAAPKAEDYGGAEAFYRFMVEELRPEIARRYKINANDQMLFGHSFGGLFALDVMFRHTEAFQTYLIASPSIFWNKGAVLAGEGAFSAKVRSGAAAPRIFISVGAREQSAPRRLPPGMTAEQALERAQSNRMVDNARDLAARLAALPGRAPYEVGFQAFEGEDHLGVIAPAITRSVEFALSPTPRP